MQKSSIPKLEKNIVRVDKIRPENQVKKFWKNTWGNEKNHKENARWINDFKDTNSNISEQSWNEISLNEITKTLNKSHKWKSPGIDQVPNFWLNILHSIHFRLASNFNEILNRPYLTPDWICQGTTYLLAKTNDTDHPKNYRPITCLSTTYRLLTSILSERTYKHTEEHNLFPIEQKGCRKGSYGCKDQLLINKMVLENTKAKHRNLSTA